MCGKRLCLLLIAYGLGGASVALAQDVIANVSTGIDGSGNLLAAGQADDRYTLFVNADDRGAPVAIPEGFPIPPWFANSATSRWIGLPAASANGPPGFYEFDIKVTLTADQAERAVLAGSWSTDRASGFTEADIHSLQRIQQRLAVACKVTIKDQIARNILSAYLGADAGRQVLNGRIKRGDGETIHAVIWYSDMRNSTTMADHVPPEEFLGALNAFFECTAGAVLTHGGEVLRFIGDAVLAIFPIRDSSTTASDACKLALTAVRDADGRLTQVNHERKEIKKDALSFGLGLHLGDVMYGNIGVPERVEFSVIGPAANEVARLEGMTKELNRHVLISAEFAQHVPGDCQSLGQHKLRGVGTPLELFTLSGQ